MYEADGMEKGIDGQTVSQSGVQGGFAVWERNRKMVENDAYCTDILTQVAAATAALNSFNKVLLENHIKTCVTRDIKEGKEETVDELLTTLQKLMR